MADIKYIHGNPIVVGTSGIEDGAVTLAKLGNDVELTPPDGSVTTAKLADGAVTDAKLAQSGVLKTVSDMQIDMVTLYKQIGTPSESVNVSNSYYADVTAFLQGYLYLIEITPETAGTYKVETGTARSGTSMVDTVLNTAFDANETKRVLYTPSADNIDVVKINKNNVAWSVSITKIIKSNDLLTTLGLVDSETKENTHLLGNVGLIQNTINSMICTIGASINPYSTVNNYKVNSNGGVVSATGYTVRKYTVIPNSLIYINALKTTEENNIVISFRTSTGTTSTSLADKWVDGLNQITVVPDGCINLFISTLQDSAVSVNNVSISVEQEILDGSITYTLLDNFLQGKIDQIGSITTETGVGAFTSPSDTPTLENELLDGAGWSGSGWSGDFTNGFAHTSGNTSPLEREISGLVAGALYRFTITTTDATTNGYSDFYVSLGGSETFETYKGGGSSVSYEYGLVAGSDGITLSITPRSGYSGTVSGLSLKRVTNAQLPAIIINDESGDIKAADILTGTASRNSIYFGNGCGRRAFFAARNTSLGVDALKSITDGFWNVAMGVAALESNVHGSRNIAIGYIALQHCTVGDRNIAIGTFALNGLTSGRGNIAIGADAMQTSNSDYGIGIGVGANGGGEKNIGIGHRAGNKSGQKNVIIGASAMETSPNADFNVAVGYQAAQKSTGNYNVSIGAMAGKSATSGNNNIVIGYNAQKEVETDSNSIVIGTSDHNKVVISGKTISFNQDGTVTWS